VIFRTHLAFAFLSGLIFYDYFGLSVWWLFFPAVLIASGIPDIDEPKSKFGRKLGFLSEILNFIFRHRGIFHSVFLGGVISYFLWAFNASLGYGFFIGFLSHLIADGFTLQGINFIYPFKQLRLSGFVRTGGKLESIIYYGILVIDVLMLIKFLS
jgi:inner membrane protein|tara:strand:- start:31636 stop:32100 length:465 start_codon:yes stop_codon:yes gene_type:complete